jgi:hypothetical protein
MMHVAYHRFRKLLFLAPIWLLVNHSNAFKSPGDDSFRSFSGASSASSRSKRQSELESDKSLSSRQDFDDDSDEFSDFDDIFDDDGDKPPKKLDPNNKFKEKSDLDLDLDLELGLDQDENDAEFSSRRASILDDMASGKETMYEAYNQLHTLAQVGFLLPLRFLKF